MTPCVVRRLGVLPYLEALALQKDLVRRRIEDAISDTMLLVEHPPVITMGKMSKAEHVLAQDVEVVETDRGGDVTYHGPGQVVGYPIVRLDRHDVKWYVEQLEEVMIRTVAHYGIEAARAPGMTGAWVGGAKVGAIGVRVERWVASHGFALNVNVDPRAFGRIVPCGLAGKAVTSIATLLGHPVDLHEAQSETARAFGEVFGRALRWE